MACQYKLNKTYKYDTVNVWCEKCDKITVYHGKWYRKFKLKFVGHEEYNGFAHDKFECDKVTACPRCGKVNDAFLSPCDGEPILLEVTNEANDRREVFETEPEVYLMPREWMGNRESPLGGHDGERDDWV